MVTTTTQALIGTTPNLGINELSDVVLSLVSEFGLDLSLSEQEPQSSNDEFTSWIYYLTLPDKHQ